MQLYADEDFFFPVVEHLRRLGHDVVRYEIGRKDTGETNGLLRTAREIYHWVEGQMP